MAAGDVTPGRRNDAKLHEMEPGDYGFAVYGPQDSGVWSCRAPNGYGGNLSGHDVTEHDDGTITVSPSILINRRPVGEWHGYLEHGIWREV